MNENGYDGCISLSNSISNNSAKQVLQMFLLSEKPFCVEIRLILLLYCQGDLSEFFEGRGNKLQIVAPTSPLI